MPGSEMQEVACGVGSGRVGSLSAPAPLEQLGAPSRPGAAHVRCTLAVPPTGAAKASHVGFRTKMTEREIP